MLLLFVFGNNVNSFSLSLHFCTCCFLLESLEDSVTATWKKTKISFLFFQKVRKSKFSLESLFLVNWLHPPLFFLTPNPFSLSFHTDRFSIYTYCLYYGEGNLQSTKWTPFHLLPKWQEEEEKKTSLLIPISLNVSDDLQQKRFWCLGASFTHFLCSKKFYYFQNVL